MDRKELRRERNGKKTAAGNVVQELGELKKLQESRQYRDTNLIYDYKGNVWYVEEDGKKTELLYREYDKGTDSLRYGFKPQRKDKRIFRIKCEEDRRIFTPVARNSHK